ncbi:MAG: hypothetical protein ACFE9S_07640 [Candidatus Hermodarchaeota archaeon]
MKSKEGIEKELIRAISKILYKNSSYMDVAYEHQDHDEDEVLQLYYYFRNSNEKFLLCIDDDFMDAVNVEINRLRNIDRDG